MSESPLVIDYASPNQDALSQAESRRSRRLLFAMATHAALILVYAWGGAAWAKRVTGTSGLDSRFTGTDEYIFWLIDVPMRIGAVVPFAIAIFTCAMVTLNRWRPRFLFILLACFAAWFVTMLGLVFLSIDIDP